MCFLSLSFLFLVPCLFWKKPGRNAQPHKHERIPWADIGSKTPRSGTRYLRARHPRRLERLVPDRQCVSPTSFASQRQVSRERQHQPGTNTVLSQSRIETARKFAGGEKPKIESQFRFSRQLCSAQPATHPLSRARARGVSRASAVGGVANRAAAERDGRLVVAMNQSGATQRPAFAQPIQVF